MAEAETTQTTSPLGGTTPAPVTEAKPEVKTPGTAELYPEGSGDKPEAEEKKPEGEAEAKPEEKKPEGEKLALKLPEGAEASEALATFTAFATEAGLPQDQAQKLLNMHFEELKKVQDASGQEFLKTIEDWKGAISKDPDIGGNRSAAVQTAIGRALDEYGSAEARDAFDVTGAGWNPAIVKFVYKMASALSEGRPVTGNPPRSKPATPSARLYGETQS